MAATLFIPPSRALDANASPYSGALAYFYATGTSTPVPVYTTSALSVEHASPVVADAGGKFPTIYLNPRQIYRAVIKNASGSVTLHDIDPWNPDRDSAVELEYFLDANYDYTSDSAHEAYEEAWEWSAAMFRPVIIGRRYMFASTPVLNGAGNFIYQNARIDVRDDGDAGEVFTGTNARAGQIVLTGGGGQMSGFASFIGQDTDPGTTPLAGSIFYGCDSMVMSARFHFEAMGEGRMVSYCNEAVFGDVSGKDLYGYQPFGTTDPAGSVDVIWGCVDTEFGKAHGEQVFKPIRYMSLGQDAAANKVSNTRLIVGPTTGTGRDGSDQSAILAMRCGLDCHFGPVLGSNVSNGLYIARYLGDDDYFNDGCVFDSVQAAAIDTAAATDCIIQSNTTGPGVGNHSIGSITGTSERFGLVAASGELQVGYIEVEADYPVQITAPATVQFGLVQISQQIEHGFTYDGVTGKIDEIQVNSGTVGTAATYHGVFNYGAAATTLKIGAIRHALNGIGHTLAYTFTDTHSSPDQVQVGEITGAGATGLAYWVGGFTPAKVAGGRLYNSAIPTTGTWAVGDIVYNSAPAVGSAWAWECRTAGTPGNWEAISALGMVRAAASSATYAAPAGGGTVDTQARASLAQLAADHADLVAKLVAAKVQS